MDLERIKQNLRLRSGRFKKGRKPAGQSPKGQKQTPNGHITEPTPPPTVHADGPQQEEQSLHNEHADTALSMLPPVETANLAQHRPDLPHASTGPNPDPGPTRPARPSRLTWSGTERLRKRQSQYPASKPAALQHTMPEVHTGVGGDSDSSDVLDFDLRPPPPRAKPPPVEPLCESLFSSGHLEALLKRSESLARLTSFISKYRPQYHPVLLRYLETQKAIKAVEYANAVAEGIPPPKKEANDSADSRSCAAAMLDKSFEESSMEAFRLMVDSVLPMYITYNLVKLVTECLVDKMTGRETSLTTDLVSGLSEVFCLTDPQQEGNPIIYASDEFWHLTGYGPDDVIGRNCRFLQGSKTNEDSVARLRQSIGRGEDTCETLLNYRRDGGPFINLLMIAPLHDDKGDVKYYIGAQVDVTRLVERNEGLDGLRRYLTNRETEERESEERAVALGGDAEFFRKPKALAKLRELSELFDLEESAVVRSHSRSASSSREDDERTTGSRHKATRRVFGDSDHSSDDVSGDDEELQDKESNAWRLGPSGRSGLSGKLPGVYDSYMLVRPAPSLRIVFVSPKLRRRLGDVIQHPFLSHIAAPADILDGLQDSFGTGVSVSAKVSFMKNAGAYRDGTIAGPENEVEDIGPSRVCWISATPLLGSDERIGVWIVVVVEKTKMRARIRREDDDDHMLNQTSSSFQRSGLRKAEAPVQYSTQQPPQCGSESSQKQSGEIGDIPIKARRLEEPARSDPSVRAPSPPEEGKHAKDELAGSEKNSDHDEGSTGDQSPVQKEGGGGNEIEEEPLHDQILARSVDPDSHGSADSNGAAVQPKMRTQESEKDEVVHSQAENDEEPCSTLANEFDLGQHEEPWSGNDRGTGSPTFDPPEEVGFEEDSSIFHSFSADEETPRRLPRLNHLDDTPSPSRPGTSGRDFSPSKSPGAHYMDYLRHHGNRPSSEYNRVISGSFLSSKYYHEDGDFWEDREDDEEEAELSDVQCTRSPYSVD